MGSIISVLVFTSFVQLVSRPYPDIVRNVLVGVGDLFVGVGVGLIAGV